MLCERRGLVGIDKPPGVSVVPGRGEDLSLQALWQERLGRRLWVVHRLDRDTSGVLLFALDAPTHRTLSMAFESGAIRKCYWALIEGDLAHEMVIDRPLTPARRSRMRVVREGEQGKAARTKVRPLERWGRSTLAEVEPLTGRTHQIRVHLSSVGYPLMVDHQYGRAEPLTCTELGGKGEERVLARTPLHAARLLLPPLEGIEPLEVSAPMPADMAQAIGVLRSSYTPLSEPGISPR